MKGLMKLVACLLPSFIAFAAFYLTPKAGASPLVPRAPSPSQAACFTCPPTDQLGFAVGQRNENIDPIFCSYPAVEGEDPNDFFCTYSATTGALVEDHDAGLCEPNAAQGCSARRRDVSPIQEIVARQNSERALRRAIAVVKKSMSHEEYLLRREKKLEQARGLIAEARS